MKLVPYYRCPFHGVAFTTSCLFCGYDSLTFIFEAIRFRTGEKRPSARPALITSKVRVEWDRGL